MFRNLGKVSNNVNPKKNIYRSTWKLESDKNLGAGGQGIAGSEEVVEENVRKWDSRDEGRTDMRARKEIS